MENHGDDKLIVLGTCRKAHGIKGEFNLYLENSEDSLLSKGSQVVLRPIDSASSLPEEGEEHTIAAIRFGNKTILTLSDVADRNQAESIMPFELCLYRSQFPDADENEFYVTDMLGLKVHDHSSGNLVGEISDYYENGAQIVFIIKTTKGKVDLPFVDNFFPVVDLEGGRIEIVLPQYVEGK